MTTNTPIGVVRPRRLGGQADVKRDRWTIIARVTHSAPSTLYHYTGAINLHSILESKVLWATDVEYLNDAQELRYAREALVLLLDE